MTTAASLTQARVTRDRRNSHVPIRTEFCSIVAQYVGRPGARTRVYSAARRRTGCGASSAVKIFINYRHEDADAMALLLYDRLVPHFGEANIFLDVKSLDLGTRWLQEIKARGAIGGAVLALIGRNWLTSLKERQRNSAGAHDEDVVALELELALGRWPGRVIPIVVGGATMPDVVSLPRPLRALAACQTHELRHGSFDEDVSQLVASLKALPPLRDRQIVERARATDTPRSRMAGRERTTRRSGARPTVRAPETTHYETVLSCMLEEGTVVPVLGSRVRGALPDAEQLAAHLATRFKLDPGRLDLAEVAQHVAIAEGPSFLDRAMRDALRLDSEPSGLQQFLARFPRRLSELGRPARYQMIVSTNYDDALERAFDAEGEPYDLAVFVSNGGEKGRFVHVPWRGQARVINEAGKYRGFPIDPYDELERTVIVKILGTASSVDGERWDRSYVVTEDQYIDYMVTDEIGSVVPLQILNKLTSSHCLFLGYLMRDWSLRVFLKRVWRGRPLEDKSWAIEGAPDQLEKDFWNSLQVELLAASPDGYAEELDARIGRGA